MNDKQYKLLKMIVTIFLGPLGVHKFMEKKYALGVIYFFTVGIFCFGWLYDIFKSIAEFISASKKDVKKDSSVNKSCNKPISQQYINSSTNVKLKDKDESIINYEQVQKTEVKKASVNLGGAVAEKINIDVSNVEDIKEDSAVNKANNTTLQQHIKLTENVKLQDKEEAKINYEQAPKTEVKKAPVNLGYAVAEEIDIDISNIEDIRKEFIAFDVETSGLSPKKDRIIELGAVLFENGKPIKKFSSLVNAGVTIPKAVERINHITNEMIQNASSEDEVYLQFLEFIDRSANGDTVMCAHNAQFDFSFLCNTIARLGYKLEIKFIDTLSLSRNYLQGLENHKQKTIESYFGLDSSNSHRAVFDAENCGKILVELLNYADEEAETLKQQSEKYKPSKDELYICAFIQYLITERGADTELIRLKHISNNYVEVKCFYTIAKIKCSKKGNYILIDRDVADKYSLNYEPCTQSEGNNFTVRVLFDTAFEFEPLADYFYARYLECFNGMNRYLESHPKEKREAEIEAKLLKKLSDNEICELIDESQKVYSQRQIEEENLQREKQRKEEEKALKKAQREAKKEEQKCKPIQSQGRAVLQLDDDGVIIAEYKTLAEAAKAVNSNSKSIRETANGNQKHAAGYCWKYKE